MAVKEIGIPSGFSADVEDLELKNYVGVKRIEEGNRKVILYFDEVCGNSAPSELCWESLCTGSTILQLSRVIHECGDGSKS